MKRTGSAVFIPAACRVRWTRLSNDVVCVDRIAAIRAELRDVIQVHGGPAALIAADHGRALLHGLLGLITSLLEACLLDKALLLETGLLLGITLLESLLRIALLLGITLLEALLLGISLLEALLRIALLEALLLGIDRKSVV